MSKLGLYIKITFALFFIFIISYGFYQVNQYWNGYPNNQTGEYIFVIKSGDNLQTVASTLQKDNIIYSQDIFMLQSRLETAPSSLQIGTYKLSLPANNEQILSQIKQNSSVLAGQIEQAGNRKSVTITFQEGQNLDQMMVNLQEKGVISTSNLVTYLQNPANFNQKDYPFLPNKLSCNYGDIKNCAKYYPEGYFYPDTYDFFLDSSADEVVSKFLNNFQIKVWQKLEKKPSPDDFYAIMVRASVLEKETGRPAKGVSEANRADVNKERQLMSQVFLNRAAIGQKWQSDVTAEYGHGRKLCQQTFSVPNCIGLDDAIAQNAYNTYYISEAPIGPVTNPQFDNIFASMNPVNNNYYYFLSDVTGKKYFYETEQQFYRGIEEIKKINKALGS